jgi:hypothetical protein
MSSKRRGAVNRSFDFTWGIGEDPPVRVSGELVDSEYSMLQLYFEKYAKLVSSPALAELTRSDAVVRWNGISALASVDLPEDDTMAVLLHRLRPFILSREPASFDKVLAMLRRRISRPEVREWLKEERAAFDGGNLTLGLKRGADSVRLDRALSDWLNSHEYHSDDDKTATVTDLRSAFPRSLVDGLFVSLLVAKIQAIRSVAALSSIVLDREDEFRSLARLDSPTSTT